MDDPGVLEVDLDSSAQFLVASRFWIQKVLVPMTVLIGVCGNIITVMVLTRFSVFVRRRMRCTTTIYLTALAVADIVYLLFVLLLSFEKYDRIHEKRFELYWRFFGISHWLCDAASSTSVWLTVSFTIERYIVVCHPIKGKVHCTEARAKNIITIVSILCLISTASTTFEYQLKVDETCIKKTCDNNFNNATTIPPFDNDSSADKMIEYDVAAQPDRLRRDASQIELEDSKMDTIIPIKKSSCEQDDLIESSALNSSECCEVTYLIGTEPTNLANNAVYTTTFYWFSSIGFGLLPLVLIATFNSFLVHAVYKSQKQRRRLTNSTENSSQNNENRITLLLISVVFLFLMCQTPTAVYLIYAAFHRTEDVFVMNIEKGLGNIFNFLLTLNAACNFILYCGLSAKFRHTFRLVFCQRKDGPHRAGNNSFAASIIRNNNRRRHDESSFANTTSRTDGYNSKTTGARSTKKFDDTTVTSLGNSTRYSNLPQQLSEEEEEEDNSDIDDCKGDLIDKKLSTSNVQKQNGNRQEMIKTPRNIETLSFNSIPRSGPMLMRPIGKAKSTDLVV